MSPSFNYKNDIKVREIFSHVIIAYKMTKLMFSFKNKQVLFGFLGTLTLLPCQ